MHLIVNIDKEFLDTIKENRYDVYAGRVYDMLRSSESIDDIIQEFFCEISGMEYDNTTRMKAYYFDKILDAMGKRYFKDPKDDIVEDDDDED